MEIPARTLHNDVPVHSIFRVTVNLAISLTVRYMAKPSFFPLLPFGMEYCSLTEIGPTFLEASAVPP